MIAKPPSILKSLSPISATDHDIIGKKNNNKNKSGSSKGYNDSYDDDEYYNDSFD